MITITQKNIEAKILTIRGVQVILDKDLASFYEVTPIRLREQVKRNANRFPADFVFYLNEEEVKLMVSQNAIPSKKSMGGHLPIVFTEQGVSVTIYSTKLSKQTLLDVSKFNEQYEPVFIKKLDNLHDRFLIIDHEEMYHLGASLKDLGKKIFAFSRMNSETHKILAKLDS